MESQIVQVVSWALPLIQTQAVNTLTELGISGIVNTLKTVIAGKPEPEQKIELTKFLEQNKYFLDELTKAYQAQTSGNVATYQNSTHQGPSIGHFSGGTINYNLGSAPQPDT
jgi:hypothetical protein